MKEEALSKRKSTETESKDFPAKIQRHDKSQLSSSKRPPTNPGIAIKLAKPTQTAPSSSLQKEDKKPKAAVASVFNESDSEDEEEMPPEAKMRMKNLGKFTPTSAGPNSFSKGNTGFVDLRAIQKKQMQQMMDEVSGDNEKK